MEITVREENHKAAIVITGHLDTMTSPHASEELMTAAEKYNEITLDIAKLDYVSSAGVRVLLDLYMRMYQKKGALHIINASDSVTRVLKMTGLSSLLEMN